MKTILTKVGDSQLEQDIRGSYAASRVIRRRLQEVLKEKIESSDRGSTLASEYDCPNWAYRQADRVGYKRALLEVVSLLGEED